MKKKLISMYFILLIISILVVGILSAKLVNKSYEKNIIDKLRNQGKMIEQVVILKYNDNQKINYHQIAQDFANGSDIRVTFIQTDGQVLADSYDNTIMFENYLNKPEIQAALKEGDAVTKRYSEVYMQNMIYVTCKPIDVGKRVIIRIAANMDEINEINREFLKNIFIASLIGMILILFIGYFYIDKFIRPIKELSLITTEMSRGKFSTKVNIHTGDELEELSDNFNFMAESLKQMLSQLKYKNLELKSTLSSMTNGVISVDNNLNIIFINSSMKKMLEIYGEKCTDKPIKEIIKNKQLYESIERNESQSESFELMINDNKILKIYRNIIKEQRSPFNKLGILIIAEDVTEVRKLEKMRTDFVSNVSHDLKTPLTIISGFIETMESRKLDDKKRDKFLNIIDSETKRLKQLVDDLLDLSKIETSDNNGVMREISVPDAIKDIKDSLSFIAVSKNIKIVQDIPEELKIINSNANWYRQMIFNIVDNAVKYTPNGGIIKISVYSNEFFVFTEVSDNGAGIPEEDISRIFERFYRVDKARSRKAGGTGLGLAIVKHISILMNGSIQVESEVGKGTKFTVKIPVSA